MHKWVYFVLALILHESFHLLSSRILFGEGIRIRLVPSGFRATWQGVRTEKLRQCTICGIGPAGNLFIALLVSFLPIDDGIRHELVQSNLFIGVFNLIPLYPMDGGNILLIALYHYMGSSRTLEIMKKTGQWMRVILMVVGFLMLAIEKNPSLLLAITFLPGVQSMKRMVKRMNLSALLHRRERIRKRKVYPVRNILVLKGITLGETLLHLDYDQFHIIHITDESMKIMLAITEQELLEVMMEQDSGKTMEEVFLTSSNMMEHSPG